MIDIVLTLVFSLVMLVFMIYPAMKITLWLENNASISEKWHNFVVITLTASLSLGIGLFLRFL